MFIIARVALLRGVKENHSHTNITFCPPSANECRAKLCITKTGGAVLDRQFSRKNREQAGRRPIAVPTQIKRGARSSEVSTHAAVSTQLLQEHLPPLVSFV